MNANAFLQLPPGSTGLFLEEAAAHQAAIDATNRLFARWGYTMVHTPMVDFFEAHSHMISDDEQQRLYRMIGRDGEVLMLRSDITVFLLKHFQSLLRGAEFPVRLSYSDSILRHEDSIDISRNEHYQAGAELIGTPRRDGDLEILLMLCENLETLGILRGALHMGSQKLFDICFPDDGSSSGETPHQLRTHALKAIRDRDWDELSRLSDTGRKAVKLFSSMADAQDEETYRVMADLAAPFDGAAEELEYLADLASTLSRYFPEMRIRIDPSEIGKRHYYSGLMFQVYLADRPYAVASGGRYDRLLAELGLDSGAVGYQVMLSAIDSPAAKSGAREIRRLSDEMAQSSIETRYEAARKLREQGGSVCL